MSSSTSKLLTWAIVAVVIAGSVFTVIKYNTGSGSSVADGEAPESLLDTSNDRKKGNPDAEVVLIEYGDFQCPACGNYHPIIEDLMDEFGKHVNFGFRHYPLRNIHGNAQLAAQAAEAAHFQGQFWEMADLLFENQTEWSSLSNPSDKFKEYASELGLNMERFEGDLTSSDAIKEVNGDYDSGREIGVNSTPTFFLNGERIQPRTYENFRTLLREAIQEADGGSSDASSAESTE